MAIPAVKGEQLVTFELFDDPPSAELAGADSALWTSVRGTNTFTLHRHKDTGDSGTTTVTEWKTASNGVSTVRSIHFQNFGRTNNPDWSLLTADGRSNLRTFWGDFVTQITTQSADWPKYLSLDDLFDRPTAVRLVTTEWLWRITEATGMYESPSTIEGVGAYGHRVKTGIERPFGTMLQPVLNHPATTSGDSAAENVLEDQEDLVKEGVKLCPWVLAPGLTASDGSAWTASNLLTRVRLCVEYGASCIYVFTAGTAGQTSVDWSGMVNTVLEPLLDEDDLWGL